MKKENNSSTHTSIREKKKEKKIKEEVEGSLLMV
jgi:hypothetical protein